jgi:hypothetical protein
MKMNLFLILAVSLAAILGCSNQDNQAMTDAQIENMPVIGKVIEIKPYETEVKSKKMLPNEITTEDSTTAIEQDESDKKVTFWFDPMVEGRRFSKSGQSPFMDMQLVPHYAEDTNVESKP